MTDFNREELKSKTLAEFSPIKNPAPQSSHEEYGEDEEEEGFFNRFKLIVPIIFIAIVCFVAYAWYTDKFAISSSKGELPIIKANKDAIREKPEDPGGLKIVNRDKKVYDAISGTNSDKEPKEANILPPPEEPISHNKIVTSDDPSTLSKIVTESKGDNNSVSDLTKRDVSTDNNVTPAVSQNSVNSSKEVEEPVESNIATNNSKPKEDNPKPIVINRSAKESAKLKTPAKPELETKEIVAVQKEAKAVTAEDVKDVTPREKLTPQKKSTKPVSNYRIQLGSYRSSGDAEVSWKTLKKKFPDILNDLNDYIEKADLGDKGIFYRLQLSGFQSETEARKVCQKLTEKKQGCFFVGK